MALASARPEAGYSYSPPPSSSYGAPSGGGGGFGGSGIGGGFGGGGTHLFLFDKCYMRVQKLRLFLCMMEKNYFVLS